MSLFKQLLLAICLFLVVAFSGSFMVSLESSRTQYVNQLRGVEQGDFTTVPRRVDLPQEPAQVVAHS